MNEIKIDNEIQINEYFVETDYTPYKIAKIVNKILADLEIEKILPPQMFYTYAKKGMLNGIKESKRIDAEHAIAWTERYIARFAE